MTRSTATTARRHPVTAGRVPATDRIASRRLAVEEEQELTTRGNTALAPKAAVRVAPEAGRRPALSPHLTVAPPAPVSVPRAPFVALVLVVVVAGVMGILVLNTKINENAFTLNHLQDQQSQLDKQEQQLDQHLAELESPNSLYRAALKLGMIPSSTPAYLQLPNGQVVGVPQPATAGQSGR